MTPFEEELGDEVVLGPIPVVPDDPVGLGLLGRNVDVEDPQSRPELLREPRCELNRNRVAVRAPGRIHESEDSGRGFCHGGPAVLLELRDDHERAADLRLLYEGAVRNEMTAQRRSPGSAASRSPRPVRRPARVAPTPIEPELWVPSYIPSIPTAHAICRLCGRITRVAIPHSDLATLEAFVDRRPDGWSVEGMSFSFTGICPKCRAGRSE